MKNYSILYDRTRRKMRSFPTYRLIILGLSAILLVAILAACRFLFGLVSLAQPLPEDVLERARAGVTHNNRWQPVIRRLDSLDMALAPAGCFTMGSTAFQLEEAVDSCDRFYGSGRCPVDFVGLETPIHEVCFDAPFWIAETEVTNRVYGSNSSTNMVEMYRGLSWPRETVTWDEAAEFCKTHNARLPTEAEWEYAARGPDGLIYPWGNEFDLEKVVSGRLELEDVGSVPAGASWVGALDMSGSAAEWVADC